MTVRLSNPGVTCFSFSPHFPHLSRRIRKSGILYTSFILIYDGRRNLNSLESEEGNAHHSYSPVVALLMLLHSALPPGSFFSSKKRQTGGPSCSVKWSYSR